MVSGIDQKSIVLYLHNNLIATPGNEAVPHSRVTNYLPKAQFDLIKFPSNPDASSPHLDDSDRAILATLDEKPFSSVRELARATHLPPTTVDRRLINLLEFVRRHLCWVPHLLSDAQKLQRVELSSSVLRRLQVQKSRAWHDMTL
jgi:hypothetical protein